MYKANVLFIYFKCFEGFIFLVCPLALLDKELDSSLARCLYAFNMS